MTKFKIIALLIMSGFLAACGGGEKASVTQLSSTTETTYQITKIELVEHESGQTLIAGSLIEDQLIDITADVVKRTIVTRSDGAVTSDTTVSGSDIIVLFDPQGGGSVSPASGRVLSNAEGKATAQLLVGDTLGAFQMKVTLPEVGSVTGEIDHLNYQVVEVLNPVILVNIMNADGGFLGNITAGERYQVQAQALRVSDDGSQLKPVEGISITFATDGGTFDPSNAKVLTDENGIAKATLQPGFNTGAYALSATSEFDDESVTGSSQYQVQVPQIVIGSIDSNGQFDQGTIKAGLTSLSAAGTTSLSVDLMQLKNNTLIPWTLPTEVEFNSLCVAQGRSEVSSPVVSTNGRAVSTYHALDCQGDDIIQATATIEGSIISAIAAVQVSVEAAEFGSVEYVSADPLTLSIQGAGGTEQSKLLFKVVNANGFPIAGEFVSFALNNLAGGVLLVTPSAISNADGEVEATIRSGTVATTVRVRATVESANVSTESRPIVISTGIPDQNSFSLSVETLNPEAWNFDGVDVGLTIRAADHFNNWAPDGTEIVFTTEGGSIESQCILKDGACSVKWVSQNPRPTDGRVTILARTTGDESFVDDNGNGIFDGFGTAELFDDLPEAWLDANEDGTRNANEEFSDFNQSGSYNIANNLYDGVLCDGSQACGASRSVDIRDDIVIVMSSSHALINITPDPITVTNISSRLVTIEVSDVNRNMMPAGTKIEISADNGELLGETSYEVGNTNAPGPFVIHVIVAGDDTPSTGFLTVSVEAPSGTKTIAQAIIIDTFIDPCSFSPMPPECTTNDGGGDTTPIVAAIAANPASIQVAANSQILESIDLTITDDAGNPIEGIVVTSICDDTQSTDIVSNITSAINPTSASGQTVASLSVQTGAAPLGQSQCVFRAGNEVAIVTVTPQ